MDNETIITNLKQMQSDGAFENFPENDMDFSKCDTEELQWYYENWLKY